MANKKATKSMTLKERFQHDASKIVEMSQFLQAEGGAGWAQVPVDGGKQYIGLLFDAEHWAIIEGELLYHPSGTFAGDGMEFASIEPIKSKPYMPKKGVYDSDVGFYLNPWGFLQAVPKKNG